MKDLCQRYVDILDGRRAKVTLDTGKIYIGNGFQPCVATYKDGEFEVTKSTCTDNHSGHKLYNYIVLDKDKGAATFANLFMLQGSF